MGDVMEFDMGNGRGRARPPPRIASRLASGRRSSGAKSTDGPIRARPPSGRADSKAADSGATTARRSSAVTTDSLRSRGKDSSVRGRGSSDDEAAAKPVARRAPGSPPLRASTGHERRGSFDATASAANGVQFRLGQNIEGRYRGKGRWYKGRIIGVNPRGTYDVRYDDGDEDLGLDVSAIKSADDVGASASSARTSGNSSRAVRTPRIGDRVEAKVPGSAKWLRATVVGENRDGTLDVRFRDGAEEKHLEPGSVQMLEDEDKGAERGQERRSADLFRVGDDIEARYRGKSKWFKGVIRRVNSDNTYDIRYADGDQETGVDSTLVRSNGGGSLESSISRSASYRVGDKVEAKFGGRARWFRATVERENRDGTFHLLYADGDEERAVDKSLMRKIDGEGPRSGSRSPGRRVISGTSSDTEFATPPSFRQGDKIEARYKRGRSWYSGSIRAVGRDGTYDIRYEDGDTENGVDPGLVRGVGAGSTESLAPMPGVKGQRRELLEGEKVEARFGGRSRWFKATVRRKNRDGTYHLLYNDGDEETSVEIDMIRSIGESAPQGGAKSSQQSSSRDTDRDSYAAGGRKLRVGDDIEARYKRGLKWYPGVVRAVNRDGTCDIRYADGDTERDVEPSLVRGKGGASTDSLASPDGAKVDFSRGEKVEARFGGRSRWFKATVERENRDGTYHLLYEDGDEERAVHKGLIRQLGGVGSGKARVGPGTRGPSLRARGGIESDSELKDYRVGDSIEARYKRGQKWYPGVIRAANRNGTYDIRYKDGDLESDVEAVLIRGTGKASVDSLASSTLAEEGGNLKEGERVEARFGGRSRWYKATVERKNRDGTYFLVYADGDEERTVERGLIRRLGDVGAAIGSERPSIASAAKRIVAQGNASDVETKGKHVIHVGDEIEARFKGGRKWYPGVVRAVNRDGTYDVRYKDGDVENDVDATLVRAVSVSSLASEAERKRSTGEYFEGDKVEARFNGRSRWFKAKVARVNRDGTYHLVYVDGDEERSVSKSLMRGIGEESMQGSKGESRAGMPSGAGGGNKKHRMGDEIEARYKKGRKWYPGIVRAINRDGTYDIRYSDGGSERDVEPAMVRVKEGASAASLDSAENEFIGGDKVEARFRGGSRWFKATVERQNRDGTYYLRYADGDEEKNVEIHLIRRGGAGASIVGTKSPGRRVVSGAESDADASASKVYRVADEVEARYKRGPKWFPGVIRSVNLDGTYDIRYKDGDSERDVDPRFVRDTGARSSNSLATTTSTAGEIASRSRRKDFSVGDKVEARFGGRSRWFKATVERKNRDGTYHLLYADGDEERSVENDLIRMIDAGGQAGSRSRSPGRRVVSGAGTDNEGGISGAKLRKGDEIEARYKRGRKWFPGVIHTVNRDGTFDIRYRDGDSERSVDHNLIRTKGADVDSLASGVDNRDTASFAVGDEVEARFGGRSRWFKATVKRENRDGTYHLLYANGDEEKSVEKELVRRINRKGDRNGRSPDRDTKPTHRRDSSLESLSSNATGLYRMGDKVEARFRGGSRWFKATVEKENLDGTYNLHYADGDKERSVSKDMIKSLALTSDEAKGVTDKQTAEVHRVGDEIEARYKRGRKWFPGIIRAVNLDGTYFVRYKDGDTERDVQASLVRRAATSRVDSLDSEEDSVFRVGDKVEARFGGRSRWYEATVERKNRDGTYHLLYADGDEEKSVEKRLMREMGGGRKKPALRDIGRRLLSGGRGSETDGDRGEAKIDVHEDASSKKPGRDPPQAGDKIEARFRGGSRWLPGTVSTTHRGGSYDIAYANGDSDRDVPASHVRPKATGRRGTSSDTDSNHRADANGAKARTTVIVQGDRVEARLHGRSTWHKGKVSRVRSDGTYDVRYGDGNEEKGIHSRLVRLQSEDSSANRRRQDVGSSSDTTDSRANRRGRSKERTRAHHEPANDDAEATATRVRRALRKAGKTTDDLTRKLERVRRADGGSIDMKSLSRVLAGIGVDLSSSEARDLSRCCADVDRNGCVDPGALSSLVKGDRKSKSGGSADKPGSYGPRGRQHRSSSSASEDSNGGARASRRSRSRGSSRRRGATSSPSDRSSSESWRPRSRSSRRDKSRGATGDEKAVSRTQSPSVRQRNHGAGSIGTSTESERGGNTSSDGHAYGARGGLVTKKGFAALKKLEVTAFDGTLRREFQKICGDRGHGLSKASFKRLLRRLRITLDEVLFGDLVAILDSDDHGAFTLDVVLEMALSRIEEKKVAKIHGAIRKQLFTPTGRGGKRGETKEAKAASAAVFKALSKMEQPKGSGLLRMGDLKKLLQKAGASIPGTGVQVLQERLDPNDRGKVDQRALAMWLTSGCDPHQTESRASRQLHLLKAKVRKPEKKFREFDIDREGAVTKADFILALGQLGLVLTHGQATALAAEHHEDYEKFLSKLGDARRSSEGGDDSDGSESETNGRSKHGGSRAKKNSGRPTRRNGNADDFSDGSDEPLTSGPSDDDEQEEDRWLLSKRARMALRDAFKRACSSTGGVRETFFSAGGQSGNSKSRGDTSIPDDLIGREQIRRFLRRLKLDVSDHDRAALLDVLAGSTDDVGGRGVSFEKQGGKSRPGRGQSGDDGRSGESVRVSYRDFLELLLTEQEPKEIAKVHGRMWKDLAKAALKKKACPFSLVVRAFSKHDTEEIGFVKASDFKRCLERMGVGGLSSAEKSLLVRRFDPAEEGLINHEMFATWLSSGLDPDRLTAKMGRLLGQLTGKASNGGQGGGDGKRSKGTKGAKGAGKILKGGVRGVFEAIDREGAGTVSQHDMKVALRKTLGLPLMEGDLRALFARLDKDGDGMLDYEELLVLASKRKRARGDDDGDSGGGMLSRLKNKGSALMNGSPSKGSRDRRRNDGTEGNSDTDSTDENPKDSEEGEVEEESDEKKRRRKDKKKKKKKKKDIDSKDSGGRGTRSGSPSKKARREGDLVRLRMSILQQSMVAAREKGQDEQHEDDSETGVPAAVDWVPMFENKDRAGTGKATADDLKGVLEEGGVRVSAVELALLMSRFAAPSPGDRNDGTEGRSEDDESMSSEASLDYDAFTRWLSEGGGLDDALLRKVQRHLKGRLSKVIDLRALFTEMCDGGTSNSGHRNRRSSTNIKGSSKERLSGSGLARGLKHAGLPLDRALVDQLVVVFSSGGGRGRRLAYADFHRMVHCDGLLEGGFGAMGGGSGVGYAGRAGTLDEQIRSTLLETVERAFAFYDEDNSNSIDATELVNILRALGHDPTRGEVRALLRKADADRDGTLQYEEFQDAVMPFLLERAQSKRLTEGEMRSIFDEIDKDRSGAIKREEFTYAFCGKLRLLSQDEAEALLSLLDRHQSGQVSWEEFVRLFELIEDRTGDGEIAALNPDIKEVVTVALRKLQMGVMPNVEEQLSSFLGMPSTCRKSVLAPLDHIKELTLQWVLMPKLDNRGCIQLQDMSVKVTTEVAEVEASKSPPDSPGQVLVKTTNLADRTSTNKTKKPPSQSLAATLGFGRRDAAPPPAVTTSKGTKTRRRSSVLGMGLMETTTTVMKRAELQEVGTSTEEGKRGRRGGVMQVELSVKRAFGIPVARDSRMRDIRQRGMRACLFYDAGNEVDRDAGEPSGDYGEHFLCNTYKTLAVQDPQKEEQWIFPDSSEGERKFLVRTDFGSGGGAGESRRDRRHYNRQGSGENSPPRRHASGNKDKLFLLVELTCTVQTHKDGSAAAAEDDGYGGLSGGGARGSGWGKGNRNDEGGGVRGPLKNFRAGSPRRRKKGKHGDSEYSGGDSSEGEDDLDGSDYLESDADDGEGSDTTSTNDSTGRGGKSTKKRGRKRAGDDRGRTQKNRSGDDDSSTTTTPGASSDSSNRRGGGSNPAKQRARGRGLFQRDRGHSGDKRGLQQAGKSNAQRRNRRTRSVPPPRNRRGGRETPSRRLSNKRGGIRSEEPGDRARDRKRKSSTSSTSSSDGMDGDNSGGAASGHSEPSSSSTGRKRARGENKGDRGREWRGGWSSRRNKNSQGRSVAGAGGSEEVVEVEMSCGWVLIPFAELAETQEVKKLRYSLTGGTPFAKTDINQDEVMTRRYGWRAVLKAMKIEGTHKASEVEIKILPVKTLSKVKQEDIFRLPRNVVLSDTFVSLVRHYREYAANSLAKRSAKGLGNAGFGAGSASSEPVLALFPRLSSDPALMIALKNQWEAEVRKTHVDSKLGATISAGLAGIGLGGVGAGGLAGVTGAARGASLLKAFEKAVMRLWPAYCHIDTQRRKAASGRIGAESYEELEGRSQRIRQILDSSDSFRSETPTNAPSGGEGARARKAGGGASNSSISQEGGVMIAFTLKEVAFDVA